MTRIRQALTMTGLHLVPRQRRIVAALGAAVSAWLLSVGATPAPAQGVLDANCPGPSNFVFNMFAGDQRVAQTFTAQRTGSLVRAEIEAIKTGTPGGDWVMQIVPTDGSGTPINTVLASATIADATVPNGASRLAAVLAAPASVGAGRQYALLLTRPGAAMFALSDRDDNPCPGQEFFSLSQSGAWTPNSPSYDAVFAVFVEPPGGPGAATSATSTCKGAQATIIGTSGNDVRSGTPGPDVMVGQEGNDRLSGLAGKDVICGGKGRDTIKGGPGNDFLSGQKGNDKLAGQEGNDKLSGKKGKDLCKGGKGKDKAKGCEVEKSI